MDSKAMYPEFEVVPERRIAYLFIRKCGCSSLLHALSKIRDQIPVDEKQKRIHSRSTGVSVRPDELVDPGDWFKFTIVRDPIKRFFSFYSGKILDQNIDSNHTFLKFDRFGYLPNMSVDQVIDILVSRRFETEPHLVPQSEFIRATGLQMNYTGKLESLRECIQVIEARSGVKLEPDHLNQSKQLQLIPTVEQFSRLSAFYAEDIRSFGYVAHYDEWLAQHVCGNERKYQLEPGFTFENEAKLLAHDISRTFDGFLIQMKWRISAQHRRKRVVRLVSKNENGFELLWHVPPKFNLAESACSGTVAIDTVHIPFEKIPANVSLVDVYHQLYFSDQDANRASLTDYAGHDNMLLFPFGHLERKLAKSA